MQYHDLGTRIVTHPTRTTARQRLIDAAFDLFDERGYEHTTVDDIAERAGVGRTTFFRTFRSKEDVIFPDHEALLSACSDRLSASTPGTAVVAVAEAARLVLLHYLGEGEHARRRYALTRSVPALRARERASRDRYIRLFQRYIFDWMGAQPDVALHAELMASAVVTAHNHVLRRWLRRETDAPEADFDTAMVEVIDLFTGRHSAQPGATDAIVILSTDRNLSDILRSVERLLGSQ